MGRETYKGNTHTAGTPSLYLAGIQPAGEAPLAGTVKYMPD